MARNKLKNRIAALAQSDKPNDINKVHTEDLESENVFFGKRCQLVDKFMIRRGSIYLIQDKLVFYLSTFEVTNYFSNHKKEIKNFDKLKSTWLVKNICDMRARRLN